MSTLQHESAYRGEKSVKALAHCKITICGAGALGSNLAEQLCRTGFTAITVIDFDRVDESNWGTQSYGKGDVGALKVHALRNRIFRDTGIEIEAIEKKLEGTNTKKLLRHPGFIIDCFDNSSSRKLLQDYGRQHKIPLLHLGLSNDGFGEVVWDEKYRVPNDVEGAPACEQPLARNLISLVVAIAAEEIVCYCLGGDGYGDNTKAEPTRDASFTVTLKDLKISRYT